MKRGVQRSYRDVPSIQVGEEAVQRLEDGVEPSWADIVLWASIVTVDTLIADRPGWAGLYAVLYDRRDCRARGSLLGYFRPGVGDRSKAQNVHSFIKADLSINRTWIKPLNISKTSLHAIHRSSLRC